VNFNLPKAGCHTKRGTEEWHNARKLKEKNPASTFSFFGTTDNNRSKKMPQKANFFKQSLQDTIIDVILTALCS
jgi:hypothetical protein